MPNKLSYCCIMEDKQEQIDKLLEKLELLLNVHTHFSKEIDALREEILQLKNAASAPPPVQQIPEEPPKELPKEVVTEHAPRETTKLFRDQENKILGGVCSGLAKKTGMNLIVVRLLWVLFTVFFCVGALVYLVMWATIPKSAFHDSRQTPVTPTASPAKEQRPQPDVAQKRPIDLEKYIGENLISKIGIAVLIIGVGIGAKYSIDNDLISPLVRILLGYLVGAALLVIGMRLKNTYENFSAVLVSGGMAIFYFMTFAAYSFYGMLTPLFAFLLMVLFTIATVAAALNYNKQLIAHIGLVGAYCIPYLISEDEIAVLPLFSYMAIINAGILVVAFKKYWKPLYLLAFFVTWLVVLSWYLTSYNATTHFSLVFIFGFIFFVIFYGTFLAYKLLKKEPFEMLDIALVLANSFVFYGLGYSMLQSQAEGSAYLGLFTLLNAAAHMLVGIVIYRQKGVDKNIFYLISGLVLVFVTITIPVQLDGNWVTLLWLGEAAVLFWVGRTKEVPIYEKIAYPLLLLSFVSIAQDWNLAYYDWGYGATAERFPSVINSTFLTSMFFCGTLGYLNFLHYNKKHPGAFTDDPNTNNLVSILLSGLLLVGLYAAFALEIGYYWQGLFQDTAQATTTGATGTAKVYNYDLLTFKTLWEIHYFLLYTTLLILVNDRWIKNRALGIVGLCLSAMGLFFFLTGGLYSLSELRESYLAAGISNANDPGMFHIGIRYVAYAFATALVLAGFRHLKENYHKEQYTIPFDLILMSAVLWVASSELIHWLDLSGSQHAYKLGLTIFWGIYALLLIVMGIWKAKKHLRLGAIALFGITLFKLFFYDLADLSTLSKTVVFVSLGILLLIISFLYNKFKGLLWEAKDE